MTMYLRVYPWRIIIVYELRAPVPGGAAEVTKILQLSLNSKQEDDVLWAGEESQSSSWLNWKCVLVDWC